MRARRRRRKRNPLLCRGQHADRPAVLLDETLQADPRILRGTLRHLRRHIIKIDLRHGPSLPTHLQRVAQVKLHGRQHRHGRRRPWIPVVATMLDDLCLLLRTRSFLAPPVPPVPLARTTTVLQGRDRHVVNVHNDLLVISADEEAHTRTPTTARLDSMKDVYHLYPKPPVLAPRGPCDYRHRRSTEFKNSDDDLRLPRSLHDASDSRPTDQADEWPDTIIIAPWNCAIKAWNGAVCSSGPRPRRPAVA